MNIQNPYLGTQDQISDLNVKPTYTANIGGGGDMYVNTVNQSADTTVNMLNSRAGSQKIDTYNQAAGSTLNLGAPKVKRSAPVLVLLLA